MSNLANFEFVTLYITRKNYLYWILNVEIYLDAMGLGDAIKEINKAFEQRIYSCKISWEGISQIFWIYLMSSCGWTKQWVFDRKSWNLSNWFCFIWKSESSNFWFIFHGRDSDYGHGYKGNFKDTFYHQNWNTIVKRGKEKFSANSTLQVRFVRLR